MLLMFATSKTPDLFQVSQFNVVTKLLLTSRYLLMPTSTNSSTAKYARPGKAN